MYKSLYSAGFIYHYNPATFRNKLTTFVNYRHWQEMYNWRNLFIYIEAMIFNKNLVIFEFQIVTFFSKILQGAMGHAL